MDRKLCPAGANSQQKVSGPNKTFIKCQASGWSICCFVVFVVLSFGKKLLTAKRIGSRHSEVLTILSKSSSPWVPTNSPCSCRPLFFSVYIGKGELNCRFHSPFWMLGIAPSRAKDANAAARTIGISSFWQPSLVGVELWMFRQEGICDMFTTHVFYSGKTTNCSSLKIEILKSSWDNFGIHAIGSRLIDSSTTCTDIKSKNAKDWMDWNASDQISMLHPRVNEPTKHKEMSGGFYTIWSEASWFPKNRMPMWPYNALIWLGT